MNPLQANEEVRSDIYPRHLRAKERDLLEFVLPAESPGYNEYRKHIASMVVLAEGRRGKGNFVLGRQGDRADISSPLASVIAYGAVETALDTFSITVRECIGEPQGGRQIDVEIVSSRGEEIPDQVDEKLRWTYSTWKPGLSSPARHDLVREVKISKAFVFAIARLEKRLWVHDPVTMMNHLVPITNFYNELMLHKSIRDPKVALQSGLLWDELDKYSDVDLRWAFVSYNKVKKKVDLKIEDVVAEEKEPATLFKRLLHIKSP